MLKYNLNLEKIMNKNVISVIDGEAGSCGKAKVIGEIATL